MLPLLTLQCHRNQIQKEVQNMSLSHLINKMIHSYFMKHFKAKNRDVLKEELYDLVKEHGEGIYYCNIKGKSNNFVAKAIEKFSKGITHSIIILYSENLKDHFTQNEWARINKKYRFYYGTTKNIEDDLKMLVLGSCDDSGMNYFDFSEYQNREYSIRKAPITSAQQCGIIKFMISKNMMKSYYDYVGLFFWPLNKLFRKLKWKGVQSKKDYFCSEQVYEAFKKIGIDIANGIINPSPAELEENRKEWIVYKTNNYPNI